MPVDERPHEEGAMPRFLLAYHGGSVPDPELQEEVMNAWFAWFGSLGDALIDGGKPIGSVKTGNSDGSIVSDGGANSVSGYSVIDADDIDAAARHAKNCPVLTAGGSIEVCETIDI
jgi:hypothetical protein